ncbi:MULTISPECIES: cytochrome b6-f complex subunit PetL [Aerosakkonema]|uniref:Cytochrome b6-f complex subunit 6 n=1 Tax=Aerosakkonema funiforme FACHB-1375 TaxID=2949571 RepID=A0A926VIC5_9CYAN|nr:cytochrome b6-f complex subunit PetL [Aerosakkonema funiforme]MBD2184260.1 cytochrome b6-f complex subunit 6 [Aerosakkonema funiforme FACHB-1375]
MSGVVAYVLYLGAAYAVAVGLFLTLRAVKLI